MRKELENLVDNRKSFYGKAEYERTENGAKLFSYGYNICTIENDVVTIHTDIPKWDSATSLRHLKSFLLFMGKAIGSKAELVKMYC